MRSLLLLAALLAGGVVEDAVSAAPSSDRVVSSKNGMQLDYSRSIDRKGRLHLIGRDTVTGKRFQFKVSNSWITGRVDGVPVIFHMSDVEETQLPAEER